MIAMLDDVFYNIIDYDFYCKIMVRLRKRFYFLGEISLKIIPVKHNIIFTNQ